MSVLYYKRGLQKGTTKGDYKRGLQKGTTKGDYDESKRRLTTYLYPFFGSTIWHWGKAQFASQVHTISVWDLVEGEEYHLADCREFTEKGVYQKVCIELSGELFRQLSEKDQEILGN